MPKRLPAIQKTLNESLIDDGSFCGFLRILIREIASLQDGNAHYVKEISAYRVPTHHTVANLLMRLYAIHKCKAVITNASSRPQLDNSRGFHTRKNPQPLQQPLVKPNHV